MRWWAVSGDGWAGDRSRAWGRRVVRVPVSRRGRRRGLDAKKFVAVWEVQRSLTPMAPHGRQPFDHHLERAEPNVTLDAASVEAVARRVVELMAARLSGPRTCRRGDTRGRTRGHALVGLRTPRRTRRCTAWGWLKATPALRRSTCPRSEQPKQPTAIRRLPYLDSARESAAHRRGGPRSADGPRRPVAFCGASSRRDAPTGGTTVSRDELQLRALQQLPSGNARPDATFRATPSVT